MASAASKIVLSQSRDIPFNQLVLSQANVRRVKTGVSIEALAEDARGLRVVARVTHPTAAGLVERGALTGLSFGYRVRASRGERPRELLALDLAEVSLVAAPMQPAARVIKVVKE